MDFIQLYIEKYNFVLTETPTFIDIQNSICFF